MSTAPASAVPIDAPRFVMVFWMPPTCPVCSSGTAETVTAPNWRRERTDTETGHQHGDGDDLGARVLKRGDQHDQGDEEREEAELD